MDLWRGTEYDLPCDLRERCHHRDASYIACLLKEVLSQCATGTLVFFQKRLALLLRKPYTLRVRGKIKTIASREPVVFLADRKTARNCSSSPLKNPPAILQLKLHLPVSACYPLRARCLFDFACAHVGTVATRAPTRLGAGRSWAAVACKNLLACSGPVRCHSRGKYKYRCLLISHACMWERCFF